MKDANIMKYPSVALKFKTKLTNFVHDNARSKYCASRLVILTKAARYAALL